MDAAQMPQGYRYSGVHCGIRAGRERPDLALVVSNNPAAAAGVFTRNRVAAAPVKICRERLPRADARGVVICAGNANACTGDLGLANARRMTALAAEQAGFRSEQILVCSTGVIGVQLPMERIDAGIRAAAKSLTDEPRGLEQAANAILTTDTHRKIASRARQVTEQKYRIMGFAKGAAMIGPNMATLLALVFTDASVAAGDLQNIAGRAAHQSFNRISVEGHTSTNDSLILLANGTVTPMSGKLLNQFEEDVTQVCQELAQAIIADAEGASHRIMIRVSGLRNQDEALRIAKTVADSTLVKTAIFGADPNWGRIISAAGYAGVAFDEEDVSLRLGEIPLYERGRPLTFEAASASGYLRSNRDVAIHLQFSLGDGECTFWTSDLTYDYVRLNADYTT